MSCIVRVFMYLFKRTWCKKEELIMEEEGEKGEMKRDYKKKKDNELTETKDKTKEQLELKRRAQ